MRRSKGFRVLAMGATVVVVGVLGISMVAYAAGPTAKATPNTGLVNLKIVKVTGAGWPYPDKNDIAITECNANVVSGLSAAFCDTNHIVITSSKANHTIAANFTVRTGTIGNATCGTTETDETCYLGVADISDFNTVHALAKIVFS
jgi:hypothetical protein